MVTRKVGTGAWIWPGRQASQEAPSRQATVRIASVSFDGPTRGRGAAARNPLLVVDEVAYSRLRRRAPTSRFERASLIVTGNKPFGRWGEVFGDDVAATP